MHWPPSRRLTLVALWLLVAGLTGTALAPRFADTYWVLELPGHFRAHLSVGLAFVVLGFGLLRAWRHVTVSIPVVLVVALPVLVLWRPAEPAPGHDVALRVLSLNVAFDDRNSQEVLDLIETLHPDIVGLVEVNSRWMNRLSSLDHEYRHRAVHASRRGGGVALLSRLPLDRAEIRPFVTARRYFAVATLEVEGHPIALSVVHTAAPVWESRTRDRNAQFEALAAIGREFPDRNMIVIGDFNTSPWSPAYRKLVQETGWRNAAQGFGYRPTWPAQRPWLGIPIDHHLVSSRVAVERFETVGPTGSDHLAVYTELSFR